MAGIANMVDLIFFVCSLSSLYYPAVCRHRDLILYTITVGQITAVQAPCYIYRRQNYKYNSNFIPKTFANLIEPKMWPLCMASNGGPTVDVRILSWPRTVTHFLVLTFTEFEKLWMLGRLPTVQAGGTILCSQRLAFAHKPPDPLN